MSEKLWYTNSPFFLQMDVICHNLQILMVKGKSDVQAQNGVIKHGQENIVRDKDWTIILKPESISNSAANGITMNVF